MECTKWFLILGLICITNDIHAATKLVFSTVLDPRMRNPSHLVFEWLLAILREGLYSAIQHQGRPLTGSRTQNMSDQTNQAILYETGNSGEVYGFPKRLLGDLSLHVRFPSCWDGINVDSPDHKSHVRFPLNRESNWY